MPYFVYLLASRRHGTLYLGVTNDLIRRINEHKNNAVSGFTAKYGVERLVWFEAHDEPGEGYNSRENDQKVAKGLEDPLD